MKKIYTVTGMSCAVCASRVENAVKKIEGVESCTVNLLSARMTVESDVEPDVIIDAVIKAGYGAVLDADLKQGAKNSVNTETKKLIKRLSLSLCFLAVLVYFSMGSMLGIPMPSVISSKPLLIAIIQMLLSLATLVINYKFFKSGIKGIFNKAPNMDSLVAIGSGVAFGYSLYILVIMIINTQDSASYLHSLYFETAAMIPALITLGKTLESFAKGKTTSAIKSLLDLAPKTANVLIDGKEVTVMAEDIRVGDIFVVRSGESIATDGVVVSGEGSVDESMLSGESIPKDKSEGAFVYGATVNKSGFLICRATEVGEATALFRIIKMVSDASSTKAPIAKLADKVSAVFVPTILCISLVTLFGWLIVKGSLEFALARAISVLVISCPCALGLATPVAIMVGSGVGAKRGVLYKNAAALEMCGRVNVIAIDKTGTLTKGEPKLLDILPFNDVSENELIQTAFSVEYMSEHPIARAIVEYAEQSGVKRIEVSDFETRIGRGVYGKIGDDEIIGASYEYVKKTTKLDIDAEEKYRMLSSQGKTPIFFLKNGSLIGILAVADTLKEDSPTAVAIFKKLGIKVVLLTGDNKRTAEVIAKAAGIDDVISDVLPEEKERVIKGLCKGHRVAMVGDGINDAPALASADVGIAIGSGSDIAIDSADVVLIENKLSDAVNAILLGRATLRNIKQNLFWAFFYNSIGIPFAMGLFGLVLNPSFGAFAMSLSSAFVVFNALRLNLWRPKALTKDGITNKKERISIEMEKVIKVEGMMCPHCEAHVNKAIMEIEGVKNSVASHKNSTVTVTFFSDVDETLIEKAIEKAGYKVIK